MTATVVPNALATTYHRQTRTYTAAAPGGLVLAGRTRQAVEAAYIHAVAPQIARRVQRVAARYPQLAARAHRAGLLIVSQGVLPGRGPTANTRWTNEVAQVRGSGHAVKGAQIIGRDWYSVTAFPDQVVVCNCLDFADGHAPDIPEHGRLCKHILAAALLDLVRP